MSYPTAPFGYKPIKTLNGGDFRIGRYTVASTSARIFNGDVVRLNSIGLVTRMLATSAAANVLGVAAKDTGLISGQQTGFPVYDDPSTVYIAMVNTSSSITQAKIGASYRIVGTTGDTSTGNSKEAIAIATSAASASFLVRVIRLYPDLNNDLAGNSVLECVLAGDPTKLGRALE